MVALGVTSILKSLVGMMVHQVILEIKCMVMMHGWAEIAARQILRIDKHHCPVMLAMKLDLDLDYLLILQ